MLVACIIKDCERTGEIEKSPAQQVVQETFEKIKDVRQERIQHRALEERGDVQGPQIFEHSVTVTKPQERFSDRISKQIEDFRPPESVEEIVKVRQAFLQERCHVERVMDGVIAVVCSNLKECVQRSIEQVMDALITQMHEHTVQVGKVIKKESIEVERSIPQCSFSAQSNKVWMCTKSRSTIRSCKLAK